MSNRFKILPTDFEEVLLIEPTVHEDYRGYFKEVFRKEDFHDLGISAEFVQDNISFSHKNVLRGMHYDFNVSKLVQVVHGRTFHVVADMREGSLTYMKWQSFILSDSNHRLVFVPAGFANGFLVLSDYAWVLYKQGTYWNAETDMAISWNDSALGIKWPVQDPVLSEKDGMRF